MIHQLTVTKIKVDLPEETSSMPYYHIETMPKGNQGLRHSYGTDWIPLPEANGEWQIIERDDKFLILKDVNGIVDPPKGKQRECS